MQPEPPHRAPAALADVTIGSWLLAFNASHYDDRRLCEAGCSEKSLAVYDIPQCAGLCDPAAQLPALHASAACCLPATAADGTLPLASPLFHFGGKLAGSQQVDQGAAAAAAGGRKLQQDAAGTRAGGRSNS